MKGDPEIALQAANKVQLDLNFTFETPSALGKFALVDFETTIDKNRKLSCG